MKNKSSDLKSARDTTALLGNFSISRLKVPQNQLQNFKMLGCNKTLRPSIVEQAPMHAKVSLKKLQKTTLQNSSALRLITATRRSAANTHTHANAGQPSLPITQRTFQHSIFPLNKSQFNCTKLSLEQKVNDLYEYSLANKNYPVGVAMLEKLVKQLGDAYGPQCAKLYKKIKMFVYMFGLKNVDKMVESPKKLYNSIKSHLNVDLDDFDVKTIVQLVKLNLIEVKYGKI